jgi:hypothetical protein
MDSVFAELPITQQQEHRYTTELELNQLGQQSCLVLDRSKLNLS